MTRAVTTWIALCVLFPLQARAQDGLERLKNSLVRMEVRKGADRPPNIGTGFVISVDSQVIQIVSARHLFVANPTDSESPFIPAPWVTFYVDRLHQFPARFMKDAPNFDLAVVEVA